jgi:hypothetical protein
MRVVIHIPVPWVLVIVGCWWVLLPRGCSLTTDANRYRSSAGVADERPHGDQLARSGASQSKQ